jgi:hypothetical protein
VLAREVIDERETDAIEQLIEEREARRHANLALVMMVHQTAHALLVDADEAIEMFIADACGYAFDDVIADDGLWVCSLTLVDDGPGDWPGSRECRLQVTPERLATPDEWAAFRRDEWPWANADEAVRP